MLEFNITYIFSLKTDNPLFCHRDIPTIHNGCCVKPLSHQTALPQRLYSVLKPCHRAVGSPRNTPKIHKCTSYSVYTTSSQRPYSPHDVPTASLQRP